jgi:hypothetical protein
MVPERASSDSLNRKSLSWPYALQATLSCRFVLQCLRLTLLDTVPVVGRGKWLVETLIWMCECIFHISRVKIN